ncbi:MAG: peptide chain release factor 1 [Verrucomicrobia bacterium]|nr:MAG: peptide chain release factor 1 [Verrucomicrobiota bacterium]
MPKIPDLSVFQNRLDELDLAMAEPAFFQNAQRAAELTREHQRIRKLLDDAAELQRLDDEIRAHEELAGPGNTDAELRELAEAELPTLRARRDALERQVLAGMLPPEPGDARNTIMEIRAGAGGDEATLFAAELFRAYVRFCEGRGWKIEELSASPSECGGFKEIIFAVKGEDAYKTLKFESGVHRVQRVPETEANGRIHTSTVTVAVLPEAEEVDVEIDPADLEITVTRASGPGGQGVNTTDSAVQILHKPTGMIVTCAEQRSQTKNRAQAMTVLRSRLLQQKIEQERAKYAANRRSQIGSGDRSERIRTYNFPQSRLTDHRIGLTVHNLSEVMEGAFDEVIDALARADQEERIQALFARPVL